MSIVVGIAAALATGAIQGVGGKIAGRIFDEVFPRKVPTYFEQVCKDIELIVKQELVNNTVSVLDGRIEGLRQWVQTTYLGHKDSENYTNDYLIKLLQPKVDNLRIDVIGPLQQGKFAYVGLPAFMIAVGVHIALLQELALVDPKVGSPHESVHALSIPDYVAGKIEASGKRGGGYFRHAKECYDLILQKRRSYVTLEGTCVGPWEPGCYRYDALTKEKGDIHKPNHADPGRPKKDAGEEVNRHWEAVVGKLNEDMGKPMETSKLWLKLLESPLPPLPEQARKG